VVSPKPVKIIFLKYGLLSNPCFFGNRDFFVTSGSFTNYPPNHQEAEILNKSSIVSIHNPN
jgi:hypothetical protein